MEVLTLTRTKSSDQGTLGLLFGLGICLFAIELPWRDNAACISHIPSGQYICLFAHSPAFGKHLYRLTDVPGRSGVLIHSGNWAGDKALGYRSNSQGCILLGKAIGAIYDQDAVLNSDAAMRAFHNRMGGEPFLLQITGGSA